MRHQGRTSMTRVLAPLVLFAVALSGCVARNRVNPSCQWTNDPPSHLDVRRSGDVQHLMNDAMVAEELAIRYADATRGHRSGHFAGSDEYAAARERCLATLLAVAASTHGVDAQQVRDLIRRRPLALDVFVVLSFAMLYVLISSGVVGGILRRFPADEPTPVLISSVVAAIVLSVSGVLALGLWAGTIEMARIGDTHLSYRADRLPWNHHTLDLFMSGFVLFLATAAWRYYRHDRFVHRSHVESA
jgi:hypothetical protein